MKEGSLTARDAQVKICMSQSKELSQNVSLEEGDVEGFAAL